ncbi:MAG: response regulator [Lachnospiraceae bacterium]|nr:response regulator [Lachnospiraceae bacterium]
MGINLLENSISLLVSIIGLLSCLFRYIETPRRGWLYLSLFYLSCLMSDFYWTIYILVMHSNPENGPSIASLGWNISCLFLYIILITLRNPATKKFFHPLMLLPIPVNIGLFFAFSATGEVINSLLQCAALAFTLYFTLRAILFWFKNRKNGAHFPHLSALISLYIIFQSGMMYFDMLEWEGVSINPYYYFVFLSFVPLVLFPEGTRRDMVAEGLARDEKNTYELRFQILLQALVSLIILGGCAAGYFLASNMRDSLPSGGDMGYIGTVIAVTLFTISVFMVLTILSVITIVAFRSRKRSDGKADHAEERGSRFNLVFTLLITLIMMVFTVAYNAKTLFSASVERIYGAGQEQAASTATYLENYLTALESSLWTTADTVDMMLNDGESSEKIYNFLTQQTINRKSQFDKAFTGIYGVFRGEYIDGTGWVPPKDYEPESRSWYKTAVDAGGKISIVSPYIDAQTRLMVITVCKLLNDGRNSIYDNRNVIALDLYMDHIQNTMKEQFISGKGYGMVVDENGLIIAHHRPEYNGKTLSDVYGDELSGYILETRDGKINATIDEEHCTLFISPVLDQWYVVIVIKDADLFRELTTQVLVNTLVSLGIFALISFFYYLSYKNEQAYNTKMEKLDNDRRKQEYEAKVLRLEKVAADEANKAKGSFLADMSHEIRTPINAILGMNEMILREEEDPSIREYAANIETSGKNLLQLINSILDFSKIEDGKMEIVPVHYRLHDMISYLVNSISERAKSKKLEFIVNVDPTLPSELFGDDARINQVIINLLTNAVKYTHEGSVTLCMESAGKTGDRLQLHVEVRDTGIGIKESEMDKLFVSFERLDIVKNRNIEGTGLGMSICTKLLSLMDSELKVQSTYGEGSVFSFDIIQKIENDTPIGDYQMLPPEDSYATPYHEIFHAPDAHILIVDDTKMNIMVASGLLKKTGIIIDSAMNGPDAIDLTNEKHYDVILLDQRMPRMGGTETLQIIRSSEEGKNKETPVICLTADAITGAKERYIAEGFTDYLTKPINSRSLEQMLLTYLPPEKVKDGSVNQPESVSEKDPESSSGLESLLDTETALTSFGGDQDFYYSILAQFALDHEERNEKLSEYYEKKDWENYKIYIHSLKSSAKTIGAFELSELALGLESASGEKDTDVITRDHGKAMDLYYSVVSCIKESIDIEKYADDEDDFL